MKHVHMDIFGADRQLVDRLGPARTYGNDTDAERAVYETINLLRDSYGYGRWNARAGEARTWTMVQYNVWGKRPSLLTITLLGCYCDEFELDEPPTCELCGETLTGDLAEGPNGLVHAECHIHALNYAEQQDEPSFAYNR